MNDIEEQLWNYIDGFCSAEERKSISLLIEKDETYRAKYAELMAFQKNFSALELDEPSMGFTYKVLENVRAEFPLKPLKTHINTNIIRGIAAFFICTIVLLLAYIFANIHWTADAVNIKLPEMKLPAVSSYFNQTVMQGFLFFDVILGLFFLDHYFRKLFYQNK